MAADVVFLQYKVALAGLCDCCAKLNAVRQDIEDGIVVSEDAVSKLCDRLAYCKQQFLLAKAALGYDDGLSFMEDNRFAGFSIHNGTIVGNPEKAYLILRPWRQGFPEQGNNYQYEVATYLLALLDADTEKNPVVYTKTCFHLAVNIKGGFRKWLRQFRSFLYT